MKIYLVRHGETDWNKAGRIQGNSNIPLNEKGRELAEITAEALREVPFDRVFSSPLIRAYETAEILSRGRGLEIVTDARIREFSFGIAEGMPLSLLKKLPFSRVGTFFKHPERYTKPAYGAETVDMVTNRAAAFLREVLLPLEGSCGTVLVTAHGGVNRAILNFISPRPREEFWTAYPQRNCAVNLLELKSGVFTILETGILYYKARRTASPL